MIVASLYFGMSLLQSRAAASPSLAAKMNDVVASAIARVSSPSSSAVQASAAAPARHASSPVGPAAHTPLRRLPSTPASTPISPEMFSGSEDEGIMSQACDAAESSKYNQKLKSDRCNVVNLT